MSVTASPTSCPYRRTHLETFDAAKTGVKGLVDSQITTIPRIFVHSDPVGDLSGDTDGLDSFAIPVIDLAGGRRVQDSEARAELVSRLGAACEEWGFFRVVNHGIERDLLEGLIDGVRRFHEEVDEEAKKGFYSRDETRKVKFNTNFDFHKAPAANWRDSLYCDVAPDPPSPDEFPAPCRLFDDSCLLGQIYPIQPNML